MNTNLTNEEREALWWTIASVRDGASRVPNDADTDDIIDGIIDAGWLHKLVTARLAAQKDAIATAIENERHIHGMACGEAPINTPLQIGRDQGVSIGLTGAARIVREFGTEQS